VLAGVWQLRKSAAEKSANFFFIRESIIKLL
jgi:hypothetical protein